MSTLKNRANLQLSSLETRLTPAVSVLFTGGNLTITGDNTANDLEIKMTGTNQAKVTNNGTLLGVYALTGNLNIRMGNSADTVTINLNTFGLAGNVTVSSTGNGDDSVSVENKGATKAIAGRLTVNLGNGADTINVGAVATDKVSVGGGVFLNGGLGNNVVTLGNDSKDVFAGQTVLTRFSTVTLGGDFGAVVVNNGGSNVANTASLTGNVAGNLTVTGGNGNDVLNVVGKVGGNVVFSAGEGKNTLGIGGTINGSLTYVGGNGGNKVTFEGSNVFGETSLVFGNGDNTYTFTGTNLFAGALSVNAGNGVDNIALNPTTTINGNITLNLGNGTNSFSTVAATINSGSVHYTGGSGTDSIDINAAYTFALFANLGAGADTFNYSAAGATLGSAYIDFGVDFDTDVYLQTPLAITWPQTLLNLP